MYYITRRVGHCGFSDAFLRPGGCPFLGFLTGLRLAILHGLHVRIDNRFLSEALAECIFDEAGGGVCFVDSGLSIHAKVYLNGAIGSDAAGAEIVGVAHAGITEDEFADGSLFLFGEGMLQEFAHTGQDEFERHLDN